MSPQGTRTWPLGPYSTLPCSTPGYTTRAVPARTRGPTSLSLGHPEPATRRARSPRSLRRSRERSPTCCAAIGELHDGGDQRRAIEQGAVVVVGVLDLDEA